MRLKGLQWMLISRKACQKGITPTYPYSDVYLGGFTRLREYEDEDLWNAIAGGSMSFHHPLGTVALGTVVEGKTWRVKGLKGIRVVDSSTMPNMPTCHIMASVYAYAHHAAQLIRKQDK